jgi:thiamine biosynthesis protein ThiS
MNTKAASFSIFFNGESFTLKTYKIFTLDNLSTFFNYKKNLNVLEYNGRIVHPKIWPLILLKKDDKIEVITIVGGG